jgi:hypothetical protein
MAERRNKNRGYQQLRVWQDAVQLYRLTCQAVRNWPFERKKVLASHRVGGFRSPKHRGRLL